jgi:hypothetical protein
LFDGDHPKEFFNTNSPLSPLNRDAFPGQKQSVFLVRVDFASFCHALERLITKVEQVML